MRIEAPRIDVGEKIAFFSEEQCLATMKWLDTEGYE